MTSATESAIRADMQSFKDHFASERAALTFCYPEPDRTAALLADPRATFSSVSPGER